MIRPSRTTITALCLTVVISTFAGAQVQLNIPPGGKAEVEATLALQAARVAALSNRGSPVTQPSPTQPVSKQPPVTAKQGSGTIASKPAPVAKTAPDEVPHTSLAIADYRKGSGATLPSRLVKVASGSPGDAAADYLDLIGAEVAVFPDELVAALSLASLPDAIPFNSPKLDEGMLEYEWSLVIDLQGDGRDDYMLALSAFKAPGAEAFTASPLDACMMNLWKSEGSNIDQVDVGVRAEIRGTVLILTLPDSPALPLRLITGKTKMRVDTYGDSGGGAVLDSLSL